MVDEIFTHTFVYRLGDGGKFITGEIEFNKDKMVSYKIDTWSTPMPHEVIEAFVQFVDRLKQRHDEFDGLPYVLIKKKDWVEPSE